MAQVVVKWTDEAYKERGEQAIPRRCIIDPKPEELAPGMPLRIKMGKSSSAKIWNAVYIRSVEQQPKSKGTTKPVNVSDYCYQVLLCRVLQVMEAVSANQHCLQCRQWPCSLT